MVSPSEPYVCRVFWRKCMTDLGFKKLFKQLHQRKRQKKFNRMTSLKGKKNGSDLTRAELTRAGVHVKAAEDKPQGADWASKRQIEHSMSMKVDWLVLVSDDSDFLEVLRKAREANLWTVVAGDRDKASGRHADLLVPLIEVENGEVPEKDWVPKGRAKSEDLETDDGLFSVTDVKEDGDYGGSDLKGVC
ncbi:hypothetical protein POTOM_010189 [Populus tomentosa]|uniref:NYN domain-containing protein n=1 Tax=Populus tomentosa TaxID=118781 RepID=A0A8X8A825_POPTO|nr:hypothetical protein POTOM_010189 [Populus tomentosa]